LASIAATSAPTLTPRSTAISVKQSQNSHRELAFCDGLGEVVTVSEGQLRAKAFRQGLEKLGWIDGRNVQIDFQWLLGGAAAWTRAAAIRLVRQAQCSDRLSLGSGRRRSLSQIRRGTAGARAGRYFGFGHPKRSSTTTGDPHGAYLFAIVADPVGAGFVESLARPGGNVTGFTPFEHGISGKWLELIKEIAPRTTRVAMFFNPSTASYAEVYLDPFKAAAGP
jgi:putative ABC transport system substrate-binding protein